MQKGQDKNKSQLKPVYICAVSRKTKTKTNSLFLRKPFGFTCNSSVVLSYCYSIVWLKVGADSIINMQTWAVFYSLGWSVWRQNLHVTYIFDRNAEDCGKFCGTSWLFLRCCLAGQWGHMWGGSCFGLQGLQGSATQPDPGVNKPERYSGWIEDDLTLGAFFVFFFQQLQTPVQLHNLREHNKKLI